MADSPKKSGKKDGPPSLPKPADGDTSPARQPDSGQSGEAAARAEMVALAYSRISHSGPLPPPELLRDYDKIVPGAANRIIQMAEQQMQHRHHLESTVIHSDVRRSYFGLFAGLIVALSCVAGGVFLVNNGHDTAGATIATASVVGLVSVFVYGTTSRKKEREEKAKLMAGSKEAGPAA